MYKHPTQTIARTCMEMLVVVLWWQNIANYISPWLAKKFEDKLLRLSSKPLKIGSLEIFWLCSMCMWVWVSVLVKYGQTWVISILSNFSLGFYCVLQVQKWTLLDTDFTIPGGELGMNMQSCELTWWSCDPFRAHTKAQETSGVEEIFWNYWSILFRCLNNSLPHDSTCLGRISEMHAFWVPVQLLSMVLKILHSNYTDRFIVLWVEWLWFWQRPSLLGLWFIFG